MTAVLEHIGNALERLFGSRNQRLLEAMDPVVAQIRAIEKDYAGLAEEDFPKKTEEFKERLKAGESLDDLLPEAFALVSAVCRRLKGRKWLVTGEETKIGRAHV